MDCYFPECFCLVLAVVAQKGVKDLGFEVLRVHTDVILNINMLITLLPKRCKLKAANNPPPDARGNSSEGDEQSGEHGKSPGAVLGDGSLELFQLELELAHLESNIFAAADRGV